MHTGRFIFSQIADFLPKLYFERILEKRARKGVEDRTLKWHVTEILHENFRDTIDLDCEAAVEYWTPQIMTDIPNLFDGFDRMAIGVDPLDLDTMKNEIVGSIVTYLSDNGLQ